MTSKSSYEYQNEPQSLELKSKSSDFQMERKHSVAPEHNPDEPVDPNELDPVEQALVDEYKKQSLWRQLFLEWMLALYALGTMLHNIPVTNFVGVKICIQDFNQTQEFCNTFERSNSSVKEDILAVSQFYGLIRETIASVPGAIAAIIVGQYMARYGFKKPLMVTMIGGICSCILQLITVIYIDLPPVCNALAEIPGSVTGGLILILTATYTYIAFTVPHSMVLQRIMFVGVFSGIPLLLASLLGGVLASLLGMVVVEAISAVILLIPTMLIYFHFQDLKLPEENMKDTWKVAIWYSLKEGVTSGFKLVFKKRPNHARPQIISMLICFTCAYVGLSISNGDLSFNFAKSVMSFSQETYGAWNAISMAGTFIIVPIGIILIQRFKLSHLSVIAVGSVSFIIKFAMLAATEKIKLLYYIQLFIGAPFFISLVSMRAYLQDLLDPDDITIVMALLCSIEKIIPLVSGAAASAIFFATIHSFPGCAYMVTAFVYIFPAALAIGCKFFIRSIKRREYDSNI